MDKKIVLAENDGNLSDTMIQISTTKLNVPVVIINSTFGLKLKWTKCCALVLNGTSNTDADRDNIIFANKANFW